METVEKGPKSTILSASSQNQVVMGYQAVIVKLFAQTLIATCELTSTSSLPISKLLNYLHG